MADALIDVEWAPGQEPERIDRIIGKLRSVWHLHPDMRLGQLVSNLADRTTFYATDDSVEAALDAVLAGKWER